MYAPETHCQNTAATFAQIFDYHCKGLRELWIKGPRTDGPYPRTLQQLHQAYLTSAERLRDDVERDLGLILDRPPEPIIDAYPEATRQLSRWYQDCADTIRNFKPRLISIPEAEGKVNRHRSTLWRWVKAGKLTNYGTDKAPRVSIEEILTMKGTTLK